MGDGLNEADNSACKDFGGAEAACGEGSALGEVDVGLAVAALDVVLDAELVAGLDPEDSVG